MSRGRSCPLGSIFPTRDNQSAAMDGMDSKCRTMFCFSPYRVIATPDLSLSDPRSGTSVVNKFGMHVRVCGRILRVNPSTARLHVSKTKSEMTMTPPAAITGG